MKRILTFILALLSMTCTKVWADDAFVNLTPKPKSMTVGTGELVLPTSFLVGYDTLDEDMTDEVLSFVEDFNAATGYTATVSSSTSGALIAVSLDESVDEEGYTLTVTSDGATVTASTAAGLYFAFQTVKKILPANVMAGVVDKTITEYALPIVSIEDEPRFSYRGFMLDVARHFFTIDEVKRMLDVMSYYKMNRFHWHLSDDQGWRAEIKKYPKLTTVASIAPNARFTSMTEGLYWTNQPYGPYYYTQEEMAEIVDYAAERHIEVIPEIDMPGHFVAALVAYPEYSCTPYASREVWSDGGISSDVLNVANPDAVQFCKDILSELCDIFPYDYIHIGGDECPTTAWESNEDCIALLEEKGYDSYRELQSDFIAELADFVETKGKKVAVWNEAITADGANTKTIKKTGALVYCWNPAASSALSAAKLSLDNVYTAYGPYYINRKQSTDAGEPAGAGTGSDSVRVTYEEEACPSSISLVNAKRYTGVQGTFWTEYVNDREYMEYLALPRLIAVAEAGWTQRTDKDYDDFRLRVIADTVLLNYNGYNYGRHIMPGYYSTSSEYVMPKSSTDSEKYYYQLVTLATDTRANRCWELLSESSDLISTYSSYNAAAGKLWTNDQASEGDDNYNYQLWAFEENPDNPGYYALSCKALPDGSINPTPSAQSTSGRWSYDESTKNYSFVLAENGYGTSNGNYYYSIRSQEVSSLYMNASLSGQGFAVNLYSDPSSGSAGYWECVPTFTDEDEDGEVSTTIPALEEGKVYQFKNSVDGFNETLICDDGTSTYAQHSDSPWCNDAWEVVSAEDASGATQVVTLRNLTTSRYLGNPDEDATGKVAYAVNMSSTSTEITLTYDEDNQDYVLSSSGNNLFPVPATSTILPSIISSGSYIDGYNATRLVGAAWTIEEVQHVSYACVDEEGNDLGTYTRSFTLDASETDYVANCPDIENYAVELATVSGTSVSVTYQRVSYNVTFEARDSHGALLQRDKTSVAVGETYTVSVPDLTFYEFVSSEMADGASFTPQTDQVIVARFENDAYSGVVSLADAVSELEGNHSYVIYDNSTANDGGRRGYRYAVPTTGQVYCLRLIEDTDPYVTWTLETSGSGFLVKNEAYGAYVPSMTTATTAPVLSSSGDVFTFTTNDDGSWKITGSNSVCWDGLASGALVGWTSPGHPYVIYDYFVQPYYEVAIEAIDTEGNALYSSSDLVKAGSEYIVSPETLDGYSLQSIESDNALDAVSAHTTVTLTYISDEAAGIHAVTTDENASSEQTLYDLFGRKLKAISKPGIYIVNGRKVLVH